MHFQDMTNMITSTQERLLHRSKIYSFGRCFLGHYYNKFSLSAQFSGVENILKENLSIELTDDEHQPITIRHLTDSGLSKFS